MIAVFVNMAAVILGSLCGILFRDLLKDSYRKGLMNALGLCTFVIGLLSALKTEKLLCLIVCMALGTVLGEALRIDDRIESLGDQLKRRFIRKGDGNSRFSEGFVSACILFCIGSMTIVGSLEAGINGNNDIIFAKSVLDLISSMALAAAMGVGVMFSAFFILLFQGGLTLLAAWAAPALSHAVVTEMSAVGGAILIGMGINLLGLSRERIKVSNMLLAVFLPLLYIPLAGLLSGVFS